MRSLNVRIGLILGGALLLTLMVATSAFHAQRQTDEHSSARMALPDQTAAIVELVEAAAPTDLPRVLRALNSPSLRVEVSAEPPPANPEEVDLPKLGSAVQAYLGALGEHRVRASLADDPRRMAAPLRYFAHAPRLLRLVIRLNDGRYLTIEPRRVLWGYALGLRLAAIALLGAVVVALLALWLLRRQLRPLEQLSHAVERFGGTLNDPILAVGGAPEVLSLVDAFNRMRTRIRALVEGRTRMLAAISHDLGTYLTRLRLRIEFIDDETQRARAARDIDDMHALLRDSLMLAQVDRDTNHTTIDLTELVRSRAAHFAADGAAVALGDCASIEITGQRETLQRAIDNLIGNALKHAGGAELSLARGGDGMAELCIDDRGPGIPAHERERVLEPFYRLDAARNLNLGGAGLGLSIVADIVRRHHGQLLLEDRPGGGLRVRLRLPLSSSTTHAGLSPNVQNVAPAE